VAAPRAIIHSPRRFRRNSRTRLTRATGDNQTATYSYLLTTRSADEPDSLEAPLLLVTLPNSPSPRWCDAEARLSTRPTQVGTAPYQSRVGADPDECRVDTFLP
jgi:hypothetical protein